MKLSVVRTYDNYIDANLALGKLLDAGIHAFLRDEHTVTIDPLLSNAINGIKLVVPEPETRSAATILGIVEERMKEPPVCHHCGSADVSPLKPMARRATFLGNLFTALSLTYSTATAPKYRCNDCGAEIEDNTGQ